MRSSSINASSAPRNWVRLGIFSAVTLLIAYFATANSLANITRRKSPDIALALSGAEPVALTLKADREFQVKQSPQTMASVEQKTKLALRQQAYNATAVRLLGYLADARGNQLAARRLIGVATRLSRREFGAQLWLIEDAAQKEQLATALFHYDVALRTTFDGRGILFPTLIAALARPDVQKAFVPYVAEAPSWLLDFIPEAIAKIEDPSDLATVMMAAKNSARIPQYRNFPNLLLSQLESRRKYAAYRQYYATLPDADLGLLMSVGLTNANVRNRHSTVGWQLFDSAAAGGTIVPGKGSMGNQMQIYTHANSSGLVARKLMFLAAGDYRLNTEYAALEIGSDAEMSWQIQCLTESAQVDFKIVSRPVVRGRLTSSDAFSVPAGCQAQYLTLTVSDGNSQSGMEVALSNVSITTGQ